MTETFIDVEFVVVDTETTAAPLVHGPHRPRRRWDIATDDRLKVDHARKILAELLRVPIAELTIMDAVGRAYLINYEPLGHPDPDIVLCDWPSAKPVNRAICELQRARAVKWRDLGEFWQCLGTYIENLTAVMIGSKITGPERQFVLNWAYTVRDKGRRIVTKPEPTNNLYWGM